jgi:hypothetical protein
LKPAAKIPSESSTTKWSEREREEKIIAIINPPERQPVSEKKIQNQNAEL